MITVHDKTINPLELMVVMDELEKVGAKWADIYKGNECVWVARGRINEYYIFREGRLVDIQVD